MADQNRPATGPGANLFNNPSAVLATNQPVHGTGQPQQWVLTPSVAKAYVAMRGLRGDQTGYDDDPLLGLAYRVDVGKPPGEPRLTDEIVSSMEERYMGEVRRGPQARKEVYFLDRPAAAAFGAVPLSLPLVPPPATVVEGKGWDSFDDGYVSDGEGPMSLAHISPADFARWAVGCAQSERPGRAHLSRVGVVESGTLESTTSSARTSTPVRRLRHDRRGISVEAQVCASDGRPMSPHYPVSSNPSLILTAPGVSPSQFPEEFENNFFDRMNPLAARELRELRYGKVKPASLGPENAGDFESFGKIEVAAAIEGHQDEILPGRKADDAPAAIKKRYDGIQNLEDETRRLQEESVALRARLMTLQQDKVKVRKALGAIAVSDAEAGRPGKGKVKVETEEPSVAPTPSIAADVDSDQEEDVVLTTSILWAKARKAKAVAEAVRNETTADPVTRRRVAQIREHVATHLRDLQYEIDAAYARNCVALMEREGLLGEVKRVEGEIERMGGGVGTSAGSKAVE